MSTTFSTDHLDPAVGWADFAAAEPDFARTVRERFGRYQHHVLATLRRDGSPRLTGLEVDFRHGQLWLGMMANSRKALDLRRDPRFGLFANPGSGTDLDGGDVRLSGRAVEVTDPAEVTRYAMEIGHPEPFHLFRVELVEVTRMFVEGQEMVTRTWRPGGRLRTLRRGNDAAPAREDP